MGIKFSTAQLSSIQFMFLLYVSRVGTYHHLHTFCDNTSLYFRLGMITHAFVSVVVYILKIL